MFVWFSGQFRIIIVFVNFQNNQFPSFQLPLCFGCWYEHKKKAYTDNWRGGKFLLSFKLPIYNSSLFDSTSIGRLQSNTRVHGKRWYKKPPIHASKWRQRAFERLLFLALISPIFSSKWTCCFYFHAPAEDREMRGGAVKTTMTRTIRRSCDFHYLAYHFKTVQQALHCGHLNQLSGLSSPALPNNLPWFCPIWISFPSLSHTVNNAFVVAPFPPFMSNI